MTPALAAEASVCYWCCGTCSEIRGGGAYTTVVLASQSGNVLFQMREGGGLLRLAMKRRGNNGLQYFI